MSNTLIEAFDRFLTPDLVGRMASATGESSGAISKAIHAAGPLLLGGLVQRADEPVKMSQVMSILTSPVSTSALGNLGSLFSAGSAKPAVMDIGATFLSSIFGNKQTAVTNALSEYAGIRRTSASSLLGWAAPMVMSLVGDRVRRDGLSVGTLSNWLASQRELVASVPSMLLSAAGFGGRDMGAVIVARAIPEPRASSRWLWPVLLGLLVLIGVVWLSRSRPAGVRAPDAAAVAAPAREAARDVDDAARRAVDAAGRAVADLGPLLMRRLPSGIELNVPSRGIENQVVEFIEDTRQPLEPARWFNFDRLLFATNSAVLEPQSQEQLENVAEILKAYPSVRVKIGGYTDSAGDPRANLRLSAERAASVTNELVRLGVVANRLEAEGYGQEHPVADNSTEAGRARNRRIALRVTHR